MLSAHFVLSLSLSHRRIDKAKQYGRFRLIAQPNKEQTVFIPIHTFFLHALHNLIHLTRMDVDALDFAKQLSDYERQKTKEYRGFTRLK